MIEHSEKGRYFNYKIGITLTLRNSDLIVKVNITIGVATHRKRKNTHNEKYINMMVYGA